MKYLLTLVTIVIAFNVDVEAGTYTAIIKSMATTCKVQEGASDQDVEDLANGKAPETKEGKCMSACMGKQFGIIIDDRLSKDGFINKVYFFLNSESDRKKASDIAEECKNVTNGDRCEAAFLIWKCIEAGAITRNLTLF